MIQHDKIQQFHIKINCTVFNGVYAITRCVINRLQNTLGGTYLLMFIILKLAELLNLLEFFYGGFSITVIYIRRI